MKSNKQSCNTCKGERIPYTDATLGSKILKEAMQCVRIWLAFDVNESFGQGYYTTS